MLTALVGFSATLDGWSRWSPMPLREGLEVRQEWLPTQLHSTVEHFRDVSAVVGTRRHLCFSELSTQGVKVGRAVQCAALPHAQRTRAASSQRTKAVAAGPARKTRAEEPPRARLRPVGDRAPAVVRRRRVIARAPTPEWSERPQNQSRRTPDRHATRTGPGTRRLNTAARRSGGCPGRRLSATRARRYDRLPHAGASAGALVAIRHRASRVRSSVARTGAARSGQHSALGRRGPSSPRPKRRNRRHNHRPGSAAHANQ